MAVAGNIEAIRDWANTCFYTKDEMADMFIRIDSGLKAYKFTILHKDLIEITITENASTDPQSYTVRTNEYGIYKGIFFFHPGSTIYLNDTYGLSVEYVLEVSEDIIELTQPVIATPVMTSNTTPSGICRASSVHTQQGSHLWDPWNAFKQIADVYGWAAQQYLKVGEWMEYEFLEKVPIVKFQYINRYWTQPASDACPATRFKLQASNDGTNYIDLGDYFVSNLSVGAMMTHNLKNVTPYKIYRILIVEADNGKNFVTVGGINLFKPDVYIPLKIATPVMTSNTTPSGVCRASSIYSDTYQAYKAFGQEISVDGWAPQNNKTVGEWVEYESVTPITALKIDIATRNASISAPPTKVEILGSNNGSDYTSLGYLNMPLEGANVTYRFSVPNPEPYKIYRVKIVESNNGVTYAAIGCINILELDQS